MMCKFEHDGDCCNCGSPQYMCKCKPKLCGSLVPMTNADRIRAMSDEELAEFLSDFKDCAGDCFVGKGIKDCSGICATSETLGIWLRQPAEEDA